MNQADYRRHSQQQQRRREQPRGDRRRRLHRGRSERRRHAYIHATRQRQQPVFAERQHAGRSARANLNYESAASYHGRRPRTDSGGLSFDKSFTINIQNVNEVTGFDVQRGNLERSYIRYVDLVFESSAGLSQLVAEGRMQLTRYSLTGTGGAAVSLAGKMTVVGNTVAIDFGSGGIGGSRNSAAGDGYYRLGIDTDHNGSLETQRNFYRLLGDTNGDRVVNATDDNNVVEAMGTKGINLPADVNGDGVVNNTDRKIVRRQLGNRLASGLPLDD